MPPAADGRVPDEPEPTFWVVAFPETGDSTSRAGVEIRGGDATSEFQQWSVDFDTEMRKAVVAAIMTRLNEATTNLDNRNAQIERLHVESELYRSQIQHLRDRLKEWKIEKE